MAASLSSEAIGRYWWRIVSLVNQVQFPHISEEDAFKDAEMGLRLALIVGVSAAVLGQLYERSNGVTKGVFCNAITGLFSPHLMIMGIFAYFGLSLVALAVASVPKLAVKAASVSRELALLEIQWCAATAGLLCGIVGFTSDQNPARGLALTIFSVVATSCLAVVTWLWAELIRDAVADSRLSQAGRLRRALLALTLLGLLWGPFADMQDWTPLGESVMDCGPQN